MPARYLPRDARMRQLLAQEAARLMAEEGIKDYYTAKCKAAERIGASGTKNLPRNSEIEQARSELHNIFHADTHPQRLLELRTAAAQAMRLFTQFEPRLIGAVLSGVVEVYTDIELHLFAATPEEVQLFFVERRIPYSQSEKRLRMSRDNYQNFPVYEFGAGDWTIIVTVFPLAGLRHPPLNPIDGRPERRINLAALSQLLADSTSSSKLANNAHNSSNVSIHASGCQ